MKIRRNILVAVVMAAVMVSCGPTWKEQVHCAAKDGDLEKLKQLLTRKPELVNARNNKGCTPLHVAAEFGKKDAAALLLAYHAEINARDSHGQTPLHVAARTRHKDMVELHKDMVELLVVRGAEVNPRDLGRCTPLDVAQMTGQPEIADLLRQHGGQDLYAKEKEFINAVKCGDVVTAKQLLACHPEFLDVRIEGGATALHAGSTWGRKEVVELLLANKADVNASDAEGRTPVDSAEISERIEVAVVLRLHGGRNSSKRKEIYRAVIAAEISSVIKNGTSAMLEQLLVNAPGFENWRTGGYGFMPLHVAALEGKTDMVKVLLDKRADFDARDVFGDTPLHCAASKGHKKIAELLLAKGACINAKQINGLTPVDSAAKANQVEMVAFLRQRGGKNKEETVNIFDVVKARDVARTKQFLESNPESVNARDFLGCTPLHYAARGCKKDMLDLLLAHGADINATDRLGWTPLHGAVNSVSQMQGQGASFLRDKQMEVVESLLTHKANINAKDKKGRTPLDIASDRQYLNRQSKSEIAAFLRAHGGKSVKE